MPSIKILSTGYIDTRDSAFPQAIQLPSGDILCSFSVGGGAEVSGGTDWARSKDQGRSWQLEGTILPLDQQKNLANFLKLSLSPDGNTIYAYGSTIDADLTKQFGDRDAQPIFCKSTDNGRTWTPPVSVSLPDTCAWEVSSAALAHSSGCLLAPGATLFDKDKLGQRVVVALSTDQGETWPHSSIVFSDPQDKKAFFEHKFSELPNGDILATAWTATLGDYRDLENSYTISKDAGQTWQPVRSVGTMGQTFSTLPLLENRLLVLYNRRYGNQAIVMSLATLDHRGWQFHHESILYDAQASRQRAATVESGIDELESFAFGFPTAIKLSDNTILTTHWCHENNTSCIRWTKLQIDW